MKLRHLTLVALGVALPLWIRQYRYERVVNAEFERFVGAMVKAHGEHVEIVQAEVRSLASKLGGGEG